MRGWQVNPKRIYRLYTEDGLAVRTKVRKKIARRRASANPARHPTQRKVEHGLRGGPTPRRALVPSVDVVDQFTRECVLLLADNSLTGHKVALALSQALVERGAPTSITVDNGTEFVSKAIDVGPTSMACSWTFIRPGRPVENSYIESFNGRLRDECLNVEVFFTVVDVRRARAVARRLQPGTTAQRVERSEPGTFAVSWVAERGPARTPSPANDAPAGGMRSAAAANREPGPLFVAPSVAKGAAEKLATESPFDQDNRYVLQRFSLETYRVTKPPVNPALTGPRRPKTQLPVGTVLRADQ